MERLSAKRDRNAKKAKKFMLTSDNDSTSNSSTQSECTLKINHSLSSCKVNFIGKIVVDQSNNEAELPVDNCSYDQFPTPDLDPLRLEAFDVEIYEKIVGTGQNGSMSDILSKELSYIDEAEAIAITHEEDDVNEEEEDFKNRFLVERMRIENAQKYVANQNELTTQESKLKEEPTIDLIEFNNTCERNPLDSNYNSLTVDFNVQIKRQLQVERMRKFRAKKRQLETPEEVLKRKEYQRQRAVRSRLKKKALQAGISIGSDNDGKVENGGEDESKQAADLTNKLLRLASTTGISFPDSVMHNRMLCAERARERRAAETKEETEARRLRARIAKMKHRLFVQLAFTEEQLQAERARKTEEMRLLRQKRRAAETPEQTADRKRKQMLQTRKSRSRILAAETPEEIAARKAAGRVYSRKRLSKLEPIKTGRY